MPVQLVQLLLPVACPTRRENHVVSLSDSDKADVAFMLTLTGGREVCAS